MSGKTRRSSVPVRIERQTLDALDLPRVDVLKLDIEGSEEAALAGAQRTIARDRPVVLCSYEHVSNDVQRITRLLSVCGSYRVVDDARMRVLAFLPQ